MTKGRAAGPAIAVVAAALLLANSKAAHAVDAGGQFGFGAGFAAGTTHRELSGDKSGGGGVGLDVAARLWLGPLVVGANAMGMTTIIGPNETLLTGDAGLKLNLGDRWRVMSMIEAGTHTVSRLGSELFAGPRSGGTVRLPCWGARLGLEKRTGPPGSAAFGVSLFYLVDRHQVDTEVQVSGLLSGWLENHRVGGHLVGAMFRVMVGS